VADVEIGHAVDKIVVAIEHAVDKDVAKEKEEVWAMVVEEWAMVEEVWAMVEEDEVAKEADVVAVAAEEEDPHLSYPNFKQTEKIHTH
jgi:hypothetical protein